MYPQAAVWQLYQQLGHLLVTQHQPGPPEAQARLAAAFGLRAEAAASLISLHYGPSPRDGHWALSLGLSDDCPTKAMPHWLRLPWDGARVPVQSRRGRRGQLQADWLRSSNTRSPGSTGSLGGLLTSLNLPGSAYALTAGHVLAAEPGCQRGDSISIYPQHAPQLACQGGLLQWLPNFQSPDAENPLDAAIAKLSREQVQALLQQGWQLPRSAAALQIPSQLCLRTRGEEWPAAALGYCSSSMRLQGPGATPDYVVAQGLEYQVPGGTRPGDSGAPLWDSQHRWVAMHLGDLHGEGEQEGNAFALPLSRVLHWWNLEVLTPALLESPKPADPALKPAAAPPIQPLPPGKEADVLARTIWGEAGGEPEPDAGMRAVACVVLNRVKRQSYWGKSIAEVCRKPYQFSCWNSDSRRLQAMREATAATPNFTLACQIAQLALQQVAARPPAAPEPLPDITQGATHFYAPQVVATPSWARGRASCARIGGHLFFNNIP